LLATPANTYQAARRGRAIGFKGAMCLQDNQVTSLNQGFTPAAAEVEAAQQFLATYEAQVTQGAAVIEQGDRIIDSGMAAQARKLLAFAQACATRDQAKAEVAQRPMPS
jgi:citrate lyase subunit beta/citryl-CoA lyase